MAKTGHAMPKNGAELQKRLYDFDARLAEEGLCQPGELIKHVVQAGARAGYDPDLATWNGPGILLAVTLAREFELSHRQAPERKGVA